MLERVWYVTAARAAASARWAAVAAAPAPWMRRQAPPAQQRRCRGIRRARSRRQWRLGIHDADRRDRGGRGEIIAARHRLGRARRRTAGRRSAGASRLPPTALATGGCFSPGGAAAVPGGDMAGDIFTVGAHAQIGLERAGVAQQHECGASFGGAAVAARQHVRGDAEAVEFDRAAHAGKPFRQSRHRCCGHIRARQPAAPDFAET